MKVRPTSVTVIAWILIVGGVIALIMSGLLLYNPRTGQWWVPDSSLPAPLWHGIVFAGLLLTIVSGIGMLKGQNWARLLFVAYRGISILVGIPSSPMSMRLIANVGMFLILVFFLFRR